jgi:alpha-tubulin suppressor-like RCC1 family protein
MARCRAIVIGLTVAAASVLGAGAADVEARVAGETGGRYPGSRIAAGMIGSHTCAVKEDGTVRCWGSNAVGQLGNGSGGTGQFATSPVQVVGLTDAVAVAAGTSHTCAVRSTGALVCWGSNESGKLGDGTTDARFAPVAVLNTSGTALTGVVGVAAGDNHTCAVRVDGTVRCWGAKGSGKLGTGEAAITAPSFRPTATAVVGLDDAVSVVVGRDHTCALRVTGSVACWGRNFFGQLGIGSSGAAEDSVLRSSPVAVPGLTDVTALAAGGHHNCAVRANGVVRCWGNNSFGQIGDGTTATSRPSPTTVDTLGGVVRLALGFQHSCARRADGDVRCWGRNDSRQVGDLTTTNRPTHVAVVSLRTVTPTTGVIETPLVDADEVAGGERHGCSLQVDDRVRCWGANDLGQLGRGNTDPQTFFATTVSGSGGTIAARSIAAGADLACARRADGTAACWDSDLVPAPVPGFTRTLAVAVGNAHTCALRADGLVRCVGANTRGQIGNGAGGAGAPDVTDPADGLVQDLTDIASIAAGHDFTCALRVTGSVRCWGANDFGQLGDGVGGFLQGRFEPAPVAVDDLTDVIAIAAGRQHACAVRVGGTVHCWGDNRLGQVGAAGTSLTGTPFQVTTLNIGPGGASVGPLTRAVAIATGPDHSCALLVNGTARCWGKNDVGQLGNGDTDFDSFFGAGDNPIAFDVEGLTDAVALAGGGSGGALGPTPALSRDFTCARRVGGTVRCWGDNAFGQLGDDSTTDRLQPQTSVFRHTPVFLQGTIVTISTALSGISMITAGDQFGCGVAASGQPSCWGSGTTFARLVSSFALNIDPSVGLAGRDRVARVTVLANCPDDQRVHINVSLTQGDAHGRGIAVGACTGQLERYEATVPAHGRAGFSAGPAVVEAEAIVRDRGHVVDIHEWTRRVELQ